MGRVTRFGTWGRPVLLLFASLLGGTAGAEPFIFSTAPTQSAEESRRLYEPVAEFLTKVTGKTFAFEPVTNYMRYNRMMQNDEFDLLFDGPHFVGWRMARFQHRPLVRFPGTIRIVVAVRDNDGVQRLEDLADGSRVCAFASPNMLTMAFLRHFKNPVRLPFLVRVQGFPGVMKCLREGKGEAAIFRDKIWAKMDQTGLRLLPLPKHGYPERTLTVSSRIDAETAERIRAALLSDEGKAAAAALLNRFKKPQFVGAEPSEYRGLDRLLDPVWGF